MKYLKFKDHKKRDIFSFYEKEKILLNYLFTNMFLYNVFRLKIFALTIKTKNDLMISSKVKIKNRCIITNRSRAIFNFFHISRLELRRRASKGGLTHVIKSTW